MPDTKLPQLSTATDNGRLRQLRPPFSHEKALQTSPVIYPAAVHANDGQLIRPEDDVLGYMHLELDLSRLNTVHKHLWLAGLTRPARPLHRQELIGRTITITEQADLHLVWLKQQMFIKPLPPFLLHYDSWTTLCADPVLHEYACGLLYSYTWLVSRESDLRRAHSIGLLSTDITWEKWTAFVKDFFSRADVEHPRSINQRYRYGELRLTRLNWIFRVRSMKECSIRAFKTGFFQGPDWYTQFLHENFGWLLGVFFYITIVLNAMQVGLATDRLSKNDTFENASYGFSAFAILVPVGVIVLVLLISAAAAMYNIQATLRYIRHAEQRSTKLDDGAHRGLP